MLGMALSFHPIVFRVLEHFQLEDSIHGPSHWGRVLENGMRLAPLTGADPLVVSLFAILHDSCRRDDGRDILHGPRAASWVSELPLKLDGTQQILLAKAIGGHTTNIHSTNPTLATCWDADRLDICRVSNSVDLPVEIDIGMLSTEAAKDPDILAWATERGLNHHTPDFVIPYL